MKVISIAIGLLFLGLGIPMVSGKAENFVVGSASPDNELRNNFDTKKLCRIFGIYLIFVAIFTALLGFFFNRGHRLSSWLQLQAVRQVVLDSY